MPVPPPTDFRFSLLAAQDEASTADVVELWVREGALPADEAERRVSEVLEVAVAPDGTLAGMSTVFLERNAQLRMDTWIFRTYVAEAHRRHRLARQLLIRARDELSRRFAAGEDRRAAAMVYALQHTGVNERRSEAISPNSGFTYIGDNGRGAQVRIFYFPGALAPASPEEAGGG